MFIKANLLAGLATLVVSAGFAVPALRALAPSAENQATNPACWPFVVEIERMTPDWKHSGTGVLVNPEWVLTSGALADGIPSSLLRVVTYDDNCVATEHAITGYTKFPVPGVEWFNNNLALLHLAEPLWDIPSVGLISASVPVGTDCIMVTAKEQCLEQSDVTVNEFGDIDTRMFSNSSTSSACTGGIGSPILARNDSGGWEVAGITQFGVGGVNCATPGTAGRASDMGWYKPWVEQESGPGGAPWLYGCSEGTWTPPVESQPASPACWPFVVEIERKGLDWQHAGTGVLVNSEWVLTSGGLSDGLLPSKLRVVTYNENCAPTYHDITSYTMHHDYGVPQWFSNNLSVLHLTAPITDIPSVGLVSTSVPVGTDCIMVTAKEHCLEQSDVTVHEFGDFESRVFSNASGSPTCTGGFGSPILARNDSGGWELAGIVQLGVGGVGCSTPGTAGLASDMGWFMPWVVQETDGSGVPWPYGCSEGTWTPHAENQPTSPACWPFVVGIERKGLENWDHSGTGVLVNSEWVLTSGVLSDLVLPSKIRVVTYDEYCVPTSHVITSYERYPQYGIPEWFSNNLSVLHLAAPITNIPPVGLVNASVPLGTDCIMVTANALCLDQTDVTVHEFGDIDHRVFRNSSGSSTCTGGFGSPILARNDSGGWELAGITQSGVGGAFCATPGADGIASDMGWFNPWVVGETGAGGGPWPNGCSGPSSDWTPLGGGLVGFAGLMPMLVGSGDLTTGSSGSVTMSDAAPSALCALLVSLTSSPTPFKCGTLVSVPVLWSIPLVTSPTGEIPLTWAAWPAGASGLSLYLQYAIQDPAAECGVALSTALLLDVP